MKRQTYSEQPQIEAITSHDDHADRWRRWAILTLLVLGITTRCLLVWNPADYHMKNAWRESDYSQIARNFFREGMNILYPRVDWRGDGPGYVEMEVPFLPWTGALLYRAFGYHEVFLRFLSAACSIGSLFAFWGLARRLLARNTAILALALFTVNGLLISLSGAIQPEPLVVLLLLLAGLFAIRWRETSSARDFYIACSLTSLAILSKSPAAFLGFLLAFVAIQKKGIRAAIDPTILAGAAIAILPSVMWYTWAHNHYLTTGLSLGLSNETHFLSWQMVIHPVAWVKSLAQLELLEVFGYIGVIPAAVAFFSRRNLENGLSVWYAAAILFYVVTADTSADGWAYYYHAISIVPGVLLMASGLEIIYIGGFKGIGAAFPVTLRRSVAFGLVVASACAMLMNGISLVRSTFRDPGLLEMYNCVRSFAAYVPASSTIVVRGGTRFDAHGHPVAYNESMAFLWMDRKGFNYAKEDYSPATMKGFREKGAGFWVAKEEDWKDTVVFDQMRESTTPVDSCGSFRLYRLAGP